MPLEEHDAIDPARTDYTERAEAFPAAEELPTGYVHSHLLMNLSSAQAAVPKMGLHWVDHRVSFDRSAGEYRVALTGLAWKE